MAAATTGSSNAATAFLLAPQKPLAGIATPQHAASVAAVAAGGSGAQAGSALLDTGALVVSGIGAAAMAFAQKRARRASRRPAHAAPAVARQCTLHGEDLAVPDDAFVVLGLAHCFEQVDGKLQDVYVLEPIAASTVEVIVNGAATSYETYVGTTVGEVMAQDCSVYPEALRNGHEARFCDKLEFRLGCAARTWMRDHAREVVRAMAPIGEVRTDFNTSTEHRRILNFVHEVKDSDNIKQDMSIDVYGRGEGDEDDDGVDSQISALYDA